MKCWIDTDAGVDDALALMVVLACKDVEIVGISCVHGNVEVSQVVTNVCRVLTLCQRSEIPVYMGAYEPLLIKTICAGHIHGDDGLGDKPQLFPSLEKTDKSMYRQNQNGIIQLLEASRRHEGEMVLLTLGPLTNVALACKLDDKFPTRFERVVVMGGSESIGNITSHAEFNFHADPEAADILFSKFKSIQLITWECCLRNILQANFLQQVITSAINKDKAHFVEGISEQMRELSVRHYNGLVMCDPMAAAIAVRPSLIIASKPIDCEIELQGSKTKGMSLFDQRVFRQFSTKSDADIVANCNCILIDKIDVRGIEELYQQMLD